MIGKKLYDGPSQGFYAGSEPLSKMVRDNGGGRVVFVDNEDDDFRLRYDILHLNGVTIFHTDRGPEPRGVTIVYAYGTDEAIGEVEEIIEKAERKWANPTRRTA